MESEQSIFVSFRGSTSVEDWINNLQATKVDYPHCEGCEVHKGFYNAEQSAIGDVRSEVQSLLSKYPSFGVVVTGHSLGAAMALLTSLDLLSDGVSGLRMFNYGCPFVGNSAFSDYAAQRITDLNRVTHLKDIVPHIPPSSFGYEQTAGEWYQDERDDVLQCDGTSDGRCSAQWKLSQTNVQDHLYYLGVYISDCPAQ